MESNQNLSKDFIFGLVTGVAIMAVVGLFYISDGGSTTKKAAANTGSNAAPTAPTPTDQPTQPTNVDIEVTENDHIRGNVDAPITIVEFSDFQCPYCARFHETMKQVMANNDNVRWVYKHFPLDSLHPFARKAAAASECADEQGKFWEYGDELIARQSLLSDSLFGTIASDLGLDTGKFNDCMVSGKYADKVESDYQAGLAAGVRGTPGNFVNGQALAGAVPYSQIQGIIDSL